MTEKYGVVIGGMESRLMLDNSGLNKLTIEDIRSRLLHNRAERVNK